MKRLKSALNKLIRDTKKNIKRIKEEHLIREYFKNNVLFLTFVGVSVLDSTLLRFFCTVPGSGVL